MSYAMYLILNAIYKILQIIIYLDVAIFLLNQLIVGCKGGGKMVNK